jgi:hypothetical protein
VGAFEQPISGAVAQQMQAGMPQATTGMTPQGARHCRFRVTHSSGETVCVDLEAARALQQQKPGAKIFLERTD